MVEALKARVYALPDVEDRPTTLSAQGARAIWLKDTVPAGPIDAFLLDNREIGHFHPWDSSLHIALPPQLVDEIVEAGWAEVHPVAKVGMARINNVMLFGPRDEHELEVVFNIILACYLYAGGGGGPEGNQMQVDLPGTANWSL
jgi:phospholipase/carboxylesterase